MTRDRLYLLDPEFEDPAFPGRRFHCKDCMTVHGLLHAFPEAAARLDIIRVPYPRPRAELIELLGEENQNLPSLVFSEGGFANDIESLVEALHARHGFPERHP